MSKTILLPLQPDAMTPAQLAAVSYLALYSGHTHQLYAYQLRRWFAWCETSWLDPLVGIQRAHAELFIRHLGKTGLMPSSINTMMHGVRGFFRFAQIGGLIPADPAVYARLPKIHHDETRPQGLDRLELIRFLQVAQTIATGSSARLPRRGRGRTRRRGTLARQRRPDRRQALSPPGGTGPTGQVTGRRGPRSLPRTRVDEPGTRCELHEQGLCLKRGLVGEHPHANFSVRQHLGVIAGRHHGTHRPGGT
ncbi:MAG TPA: site-specific integrase [Nocardioidaceae bacterium]|nr:site-specific integrase [Nocardioidaceae bacterium]